MPGVHPMLAACALSPRTLPGVLSRGESVITADGLEHSLPQPRMRATRHPRDFISPALERQMQATEPNWTPPALRPALGARRPALGRSTVRDTAVDAARRLSRGRRAASAALTTMRWRSTATSQPVGQSATGAAVSGASSRASAGASGVERGQCPSVSTASGTLVQLFTLRHRAGYLGPDRLPSELALRVPQRGWRLPFGGARLAANMQSPSPAA